MKNQKYKRNIQRAVIGIGLLALIGMSAVFWNLPERTAGDGKGSATGAYALRVLKEMYGDSYVEQLADLEEAAKAPAPQAYLRERSSFVVDKDLIEEKVQESVLGAEASALSEGITVEQFLRERWGYEDLETYRNEKEQEYMEFLKERLAVYEAARDRHITISRSEYRELLPAYAAAFGYDDMEQFELECDRDSIACEMLYDKTIRSLK